MCADASEPLRASSGESNATPAIAMAPRNARRRQRWRPDRRAGAQPRVWTTSAATSIVHSTGSQFQEGPQPARRDGRREVADEGAGAQHSEVPTAGAARNNTNMVNSPSNVNPMRTMNRWFCSG